MITREENHDVLLLKDYRDDYFVAVKVTDDRLRALAIWVSGKLEIFKNIYGGKEIYIFFTNRDDVRSYVRPGEWIIKDQYGDYRSVSDIYIHRWTEDPMQTSLPYSAQPWYQV